MKLQVLLAVLLCGCDAAPVAGPTPAPTVGIGSTWKPPAAADPEAVLTEARDDFRRKRYEDALAKHVWFHEHALEHQPSMYGVRLSFALSDWHNLAKAYPPALVQLKLMREKAEKNVVEGRNLRESFSDLVAINKTLGYEAQTAAAFTALASNDETSARTVFDVARPALVKAKEYALCAKFIDPQADFRAMKMAFQLAPQMAGNPKIGRQYLDFSNRKFAQDVATLVAILAVNDRRAEAKAIADEANAAWKDTDFSKEGYKAQIEKAVEGRFPDPWP